MTDITEPDPKAADEPALVSMRAADIAVACLFLVASAIVITDSVRLGWHWQANVGPAPGYFPFYIAVVMAIASAVNLSRAVFAKPDLEEEGLTTRSGLLRMSAIFIPAVAYVFVTSYLGIYVSSAIYIAAFMYFFGKFPIWKALAVSLSISIVSFLMFEIWFLVPLPKGPLEDLFGF